MSNKTMHLKDKLRTADTVRVGGDRSTTFRTEILGGHDFQWSETGKSTLGEVLFTEENETVIGGANFTLERLFGVNSTLQIDTLNNIMSVATGGPVIPDVPYHKDTVVCLFGVGIGGSGDSIDSLKKVKYHEREVLDMIPFRVTATPLSVADADKYWFRKPAADPLQTQYYLKRFDSNPVIKNLWRDAEGDEDGTAVENGVHGTSRTEPIETFVEIILKISKKDCREYFQIAGEIEKTRVNTIGLMTGVKSDIGGGKFDYKQVKLFSKLNIHNEMLVLNKDLTIIYRIYTSA